MLGQVLPEQHQNTIPHGETETAVDHFHALHAQQRRVAVGAGRDRRADRLIGSPEIRQAGNHVEVRHSLRQHRGGLRPAHRLAKLFGDLLGAQVLLHGLLADDLQRLLQLCFDRSQIRRLRGFLEQPLNLAELRGRRRTALR